MAKRKAAIKREDASVLRPAKKKPFNREKFLRSSKELQRLIKKEEENYGPLNGYPQFA
jgi:hypothetical protein